MRNKKSKTLTDFTERELKELETVKHQRTTTDWKQQSLKPSSLLDRKTLNRQLADEHEHGLLFADAVEDYLNTEPRAKRGARSLRAKWELLKPLFVTVRVADVDDRLLTAAEQYRSLTFVQNVLRFARHRQRERNPRHVLSPAEFPTALALRRQWVNWIDETICPTGFVTILMPHAVVEDERRTDTVPRDPLFYVGLMTKRAEHILWGTSARHVRKQDDRCLWIGTHELDLEPDATGTLTSKFLHFHFLLRLPTRPMGVEKTGLLPTADRLARVQDALVQASRMTPEAFATGDSARDRVRENIQVKPYGTHHAEYVFGKLERAGTLTDLNSNTLAAAGLVILPNTLRLLDTLAARRKKC